MQSKVIIVSSFIEHQKTQESDGVRVLYNQQLITFVERNAVFSKKNARRLTYSSVTQVS